jgi:hypothetical protein
MEDASHSRFVVGTIQRALLDLRERLGQVRSTIDTRLWLESRVQFQEDYKHGNDETVWVPNKDLVTPLAMHDRLLDIHDLYFAIYEALEGDERRLGLLKLRPSTPVADDVEKIQQEYPSLEPMIAVSPRKD